MQNAMGTFVEIQHHTCMDRQQHDAKVNDGYNIRYVFLRVLDLLNSHGNNVSLGSLIAFPSLKVCPMHKMHNIVKPHWVWSHGLGDRGCACIGISLNMFGLVFVFV